MLPDIVDLFAGCGGMSLGFQKAGFNILSAFDNWAPAIEIYRQNFDHPIIQADLELDKSAEQIVALNPSMIIGGPPCQDFSISGKRELGHRANLTIRFSEIVVTSEPDWVIFENVYNIQKFSTLGLMKDTLTSHGYGISEHVLDASYCGVPQKRRRYFLVAKKGESDGFFDRYFQKDQSTKRLTVRDYLGNELATEHYYMHPRSYARRAVFSIDEPASTIRGINRPIPQNYVKHKADAAAITDGVRALSTKERSRIQTFPKDFQLSGSKTNIELAIGNAVPPKLAEYLAMRVKEFILDKH